MKLGKIPYNTMKRSVWQQIHKRRKEVIDGAGAGTDCAVFTFANRNEIRYATCVQEAVVTVSSDGGEGEPMFTMPHLLQKCVNNLVTSGARPLAAMITLLLPEDTEEPLLHRMMEEAEIACELHGMQIAGGQTRVSASVQSPIGVITCYGELDERESLPGARRVAAGQDIVVSKWIGLEGTALLARKERERLCERYPVYMVQEAIDFERYLSVEEEARIAIECGACIMHDASEGGIFAALWELAEKAGAGLTINLKKIPIRQETVEVCELLNVNPYELLAGGCLVMTSEDGTGLVTALEEKGIPAVIIGKLTDSNDRLIYNDDEVRYMDRPKQDEIYRRTKASLE